VNGSYDVTPFAEWEWTLQQGSFEEVHATLEAVVAHLERGSLPLSETVACYELGVLLADRCERFLSEAELRISEIEAFAAARTEAEDDQDSRLDGMAPLVEVPF
jgi:exodeoxyribonuclease VII small subunit